MKFNFALFACSLLSSSSTTLAFASNRIQRSPILFTVASASFRSGSKGKNTRGLGVLASSSTATDEEKTTAAESDSCNSSYDELVKELEILQHLGRAGAVLSYDQMVFMPQTDEASASRAAQQAALSAVVHEKSTNPKLGELLDAAEAAIKENEISDKDQVRVVELARKAYDKKVRIPTELASRRAALSAEAYNTWAKARAASDYSMFSDILQKCIDISIETTKALQGEDGNESVYATMLDEFETEMDPARIEFMFGEIKDALVPLIDRVLGPDATPPSTDPLHGKFPLDKQEALNKKIVRAIGFNDTNGRIDVSVHPFTNSVGGPADVRITSRFSEDEWYQGLAGSVHEGGHAIYEQNIGQLALPIDAALSMGMHESQSLFWERHIGLSKPYWRYTAPIVNEIFGLSHTPEDLYGAVNAASRSLIRVEADELTYPLHVILRYEMERDFVEGRLLAKDIPARWNKDMKELLGVDVPSDDKGCLQDIHWSMIAYGYFPTYLIGAVAAAQLAHYCMIDIPDMEDRIEAGEFSEIRSWLTEKVHKHGSRYKSLDEHFEAELGEKLNHKYFIEYLTKKYTELYNC